MNRIQVPSKSQPMNPLFDTYRPDGFTTLNTYLFVEDPVAYIDFLKQAFYAEEQSRTIHPETGVIQNCILQIGDTAFMISQASGPFMGMRTSLYLYVSDADQIYNRALESGCKPVFAPEDMPYGDRQGGVEDPAGNYWWISTRFEKSNYSS